MHFNRLCNKNNWKFVFCEFLNKSDQMTEWTIYFINSCHSCFVNKQITASCGKFTFFNKIIQNLSHVSYNLSVVLMNFDTKKSVIYRILSFVTLLFMNRFFLSLRRFCFVFIFQGDYWQVIILSLSAIGSLSKRKWQAFILLIKFLINIWTC